jgi:phage-related protein
MDQAKYQACVYRAPRSSETHSRFPAASPSDKQTIEYPQRDIYFISCNWYYIGNIQGETQKFWDNCYKTQITSYMDMIYFYSSKYIPPW